MRIARKLVLLSAMALAVMAIGASSASAVDPVAVSQHGAPCGPCFVHVIGTSSLETHIFGAESSVSACDDEFDAEIYANGTGHIYEYENDAASSDACTRIMCNDEGETEWPFHGEEPRAGVEHLKVDFCLDDKENPEAAGQHCEDIEVTVERLNGAVEGFHANDQRCVIIPGIAFGEVTGDWEIEEGTEEISVIH